MALIWGIIYLTADITAGFLIAGVIIRMRLPVIVMKRILPSGIPPVTGLAVAVSAGSSKAGAAVIASSLSRGEITEKSAIWSVLMLPLPSYLHRWPATFALSAGVAGKAGVIFALSLLARSILRFIIALCFLMRENRNCLHQNHTGALSSGTTGHFSLRRLLRTLPFALFMFAVSYCLVPYADESARKIFAGWNTFLPASGWAVSAAGIGHVAASLSIAGGAIEAGGLSTSQAVFALILGSGVGTASRILRQNAGYYYALFPKRTASKMLMMNFATILPLILMNLLFAGLALSLWP